MSKYEPVATWPGGRVRYEFPNGYGASVIRATATLFELAVLDAEGDIAYDTTGPNGVYQFLADDEVDELLDRIAALPTPALR